MDNVDVAICRRSGHNTKINEAAERHPAMVPSQRWGKYSLEAQKGKTRDYGAQQVRRGRPRTTDHSHGHNFRFTGKLTYVRRSTANGRWKMVEVDSGWRSRLLRHNKNEVKYQKTYSQKLMTSSDVATGTEQKHLHCGKWNSRRWRTTGIIFRGQKKKWDKRGCAGMLVYTLRCKRQDYRVSD